MDRCTILAMSAHSLSINGKSVSIVRAPALKNKFCKFCRAVNRRQLAAANCNYLDGLGHTCGAGICERHTLHLGPGQVRCPHHDPDYGVYQEAAA